MITVISVDASLIRPGLWQGSMPPIGPDVRSSGFDVLVLCAEELQKPTAWAMDADDNEPLSDLFPGVEIIRAPNFDDGKTRLNRERLGVAIQAARQVANRIRQNKQVLVTCAMGLNRSGLVSALAYHLLTGQPGWKCVEAVQKARPRALGNLDFVSAIEKLPARATQGVLATL